MKRPSAVFLEFHDYLSRRFQPARAREGSQRSRQFVPSRELKPAAQVRIIVAALLKHGTRFTIALMLVAMLGFTPASAQTSSIGARARRAQAENPTPKPAREAPKVQRNLVYERYSWTAVPHRPPKTFKVNDLITIIVRERLKFEADSELKTRKTLDLETELDAFPKLVNGGVGAASFLRGKPNLAYEFQNNLRSTADLSREDSLTTRISGRIIDVKPNGVLVLEARRRVTHDDETSEITIIGSCRKEDVTADNTILSTQIADAVVTVDNQGALRAASSRGWVHKLLDLLKPF